MKKRKTLNAEILKHEIKIYCSTMANYWHNKDDEMYKNSKQGIYTLIALMVYYMGENEDELKDFARRSLNGFIQFSDFNESTDNVYKEI